MTITIPSATPARVRPLWERSELFREPRYENNAVWDDTDDDEDDQTPITAPGTAS